MTLIKIDRSSIKRNPNAGETTSLYAGAVTRTRTVRKNEGGMGVEAHQVWTGDAWIDQRTKSTTRQFPPSMIGVFDERQDQEVETVHHRPIPEWSYSYVQTPVTCRNCGSTFPHTELSEDSVCDGEGDTPIYDICPKCGEADCCEVEYERIEQVVRAQKLGIDKG